MNARIVEAINTMILNSNSIGSVVQNENEFIFSYKGKYVWGISESQNSSDYFLYFYPQVVSTRDLAGITDWANVSSVSYSSKEFGTSEARSSMAELMTIVREKLHGMDKVLDDILSDSEIPF